MDKKTESHPEKLQVKERKICNSCGFLTVDKNLQKSNYCPKCGKPSTGWQKHVNKLFHMLPVSIGLKKKHTTF